MSSILVVSEFSLVKGILKSVLRELDFVEEIRAIGLKEVERKSKADVWWNLKYDLVIFDIDSIMISPHIVFDRYMKILEDAFWGGAAPETIVISTDKQLLYINSILLNSPKNIVYKPFTIGQIIFAVNSVFNE